MATLTAYRPPPAPRSLLDTRQDAVPRRVVRDPAPRATLEDVLTSSWGGLQITHAGSCLVCGGELRPRFGSRPHPVAASCKSCGTDLS